MNADFYFQFDQPHKVPKFSDEVRDATAKLCHDLPPESVKVLMHYDATGPAKDFPLTHFVRRPRGFSIIAYGDRVNLVEPLLDDIAKRWAVYLKSTVRIGSKRFALHADPCPDAVRYRIDRIVVQKKLRHLPLMKKMGEQSYLARLIAHGLQQQAAALGVPLSEIPEDRIRILRYWKATPVPLDTKSSVSVAFASLAGLEVSMPMMLEGRWAVGYLRARGYGGIYPVFHRGENQ